MVPGALPVAYTSPSRVGSAFPALNSVTNITSGVIHQFIGDVEAEINGMIGKRYSLPLTVECPILTSIATREAIYRIAVQRALVQFPPAQQGRHPMQVQHSDDQKLLQKISDGALQLISSSGEIVGADTSQMEVFSTTMNYEPTFHEGSINDAIVDPDKLDAIDDERGL